MVAVNINVGPTNINITYKLSDSHGNLVLAVAAFFHAEKYFIILIIQVRQSTAAI